MTLSTQDVYVVGLRESELRSVLCQQFQILNDPNLLDSILTALSADFSYKHLWNDVLCFTQIFLDDNQLNPINNLPKGANNIE